MRRLRARTQVLYGVRMVTDVERAKALDQYFTPPKLAKRIVERAPLWPQSRVLEPSCGDGAFLRFLPNQVECTGVDVEPRVESGSFTVVAADFLKHREPQDAYDIAIMNPPYGYVGAGKQRNAADRLHVQHALRMAPEVVCLVRANFLLGAERHRHIFSRNTLARIAYLVNRPAFGGPALRPDQTSARHDFVVLHLIRGKDPEYRPKAEFWTDDWRGEP